VTRDRLSCTPRSVVIIYNKLDSISTRDDSRYETLVQAGSPPPIRRGPDRGQNWPLGSPRSSFDDVPGSIVVGAGKVPVSSTVVWVCAPHGSAPQCRGSRNSHRRQSLDLEGPGDQRSVISEPAATALAGAAAAGTQRHLNPGFRNSTTSIPGAPCHRCSCSSRRCCPDGSPVGKRPEPSTGAEGLLLGAKVRGFESRPGGSVFYTLHGHADAGPRTGIRGPRLFGNPIGGQWGRSGSKVAVVGRRTRVRGPLGLGRPISRRGWMAAQFTKP